MRAMRRPIQTLLAAAALTLAGCSSRVQVPTPLHLALVTNADQRLDNDLREDFQSRLKLVERGLLRIHPEAIVQVAIYPGDQLLGPIQRRSRAGLEPDLLFVNGDTALTLLRDGLVDPYPVSPELLQSFEPSMLERVRDPQGRLAGLPVLVQSQVACFNRRQVHEPPRNLKDLLQLSASGKPVGLSVEPVELVWSAGSLGAIPALIQTLGGQQLSQANQQAMVRWLDWLQQASGQQRVVFYANQQEAIAAFLAQQVAWIPCSSINLGMIRRHLGANLGVAPLPDGPGERRAAAFNRVRVIALGPHSSGNARRLALAFGRFSANPLTQRTMTTGSLSVLPANRFVNLPLQSSQQLQAMHTAVEQGRQTNALAALIHSNDSRLPQVQNLFTRLVFGEASPAFTAQALEQLLQPKR